MLLDLASVDCQILIHEESLAGSWGDGDGRKRGGGGGPWGGGP